MTEIPGRRMAEALASNFELHRFERDLAAQEYRYQLDRSDSVTLRIRTSLVALNGGSLLALFGLLSGGGAGAQWIGLTPPIAFASAVAFTIGVGLSGYALQSQQNTLIEQASDANTRLSILSRLMAWYHESESGEARSGIEQEMKALEKAPLTGFRDKPRTIFAQHFAGGAWLTGVLIPLFTRLSQLV